MLQGLWNILAAVDSRVMGPLERVVCCSSRVPWTLVHVVAVDPVLEGLWIGCNLLLITCYSAPQTCRMLLIPCYGASEACGLLLTGPLKHVVCYLQGL